MDKIRKCEVLKSMYDLHLTLISMSDDEVEIFKQDNRHLIQELIKCLSEM